MSLRATDVIASECNERSNPPSHLSLRAKRSNLPSRISRWAGSAILAVTGMAGNPKTALANTWEEDMSVLHEFGGDINTGEILEGPAMSPPTVPGADFQFRFSVKDDSAPPWGDPTYSQIKAVNMRITRDGLLEKVDDVAVIETAADPSQPFRTSFVTWDTPQRTFEEFDPLSLVNMDGQEFLCPYEEGEEINVSPNPMKPLLGGKFSEGGGYADQTNGFDLVWFATEQDPEDLPICTNWNTLVAKNKAGNLDEVNTPRHVVGGPFNSAGERHDISMVENAVHAYVTRRIAWDEPGVLNYIPERFIDAYDRDAGGHYTNNRRAPFSPIPSAPNENSYLDAMTDDPATFYSDSIPGFERAECVAVIQGYYQTLQYACHVVLRDGDNDDVADLDDNCLDISNPIPQGEIAQVDNDFDGKGNECDPCPRGDVDEFQCGDWGVCQLGGTQSRTCDLTFDCPLVEDTSPSEEQSCIPECTTDEWTCDPWSACMSNSEQTRICNLAFDCPIVESSSPATEKFCTYIPPADGGGDIDAGPDNDGGTPTADGSIDDDGGDGGTPTADGSVGDDGGDAGDSPDAQTPDASADANGGGDTGSPDVPPVVTDDGGEETPDANTHPRADGGTNENRDKETDPEDPGCGCETGTNGNTQKPLTPTGLAGMIAALACAVTRRKNHTRRISQAAVRTL